MTSDDVKRRTFLRGCAALLTAVTTAARAQQKEKATPVTVTGVGKSLDVALRNAISKAERQVRVPDAEVRWKFVGLTGRAGGFVPTNELTVTLEIEP